MRRKLVLFLFCILTVFPIVSHADGHKGWEPLKKDWWMTDSKLNTWISYFQEVPWNTIQVLWLVR